MTRKKLKNTRMKSHDLFLTNIKIPQITLTFVQCLQQDGFKPDYNSRLFNL